MILYIDETENEQLFIVAGLLVDSETEIETAYKRFKNRIHGYKLSPKYKSKIFTEFKSSWLDNDQQKMKKQMLEQIAGIDGCRIIYSCYLKDKDLFDQRIKESIYISLMRSILASLKQETIVIFDGFNKKDFENKIVESAKDFDLIQSICPRDSQKEHGLQFADNICSVLRRKKTGRDPWDFYGLIRDRTIEV